MACLKSYLEVVSLGSRPRGSKFREYFVHVSDVHWKELGTSMTNVSIKLWNSQFAFETAEFIKFYAPFYKELIGLSYDQTIERLRKCEICGARREARQVVPPEGSLDHDIVIVGRNPGNQEDIYGRPFFPTAPGGRWLGYYLDALQLSRDQVYITNSLFCHTKDDRVPILAEVQLCSLWKVVELFFTQKMKYVFLLGNDSIRQFFGYDFPSVVRVFGDVYLCQFRKRRVVVFPIYHPAYVLRRQELETDIFSYLKSARQIIDLDREGKLNLPEPNI